MNIGSTEGTLERVGEGIELRRRRRELDAGLTEFYGLWHPQPFREPRPAWCEDFPALASEVLALPDAAVAHFTNDDEAALGLLARHVPAVADFLPLTRLPACLGPDLPDYGPHWAWEIPGRKRSQIETFAAAAAPSGLPVLDWCGGKGHLGRLLALHWRVKATSLDIDAALCAEGENLARRTRVAHDFVVADALAAGEKLSPDRHLVALHACGELHRSAIRDAAEKGVVAIDVAPCCYYRGVEESYQPLAGGTRLRLSRDDLRLAVTETVTAAPRQARRRDRDMAWKLAFDSLRREMMGSVTYQPFKPVSPAWLADGFEPFIHRMAGREGLVLPAGFRAQVFEARGWQRQGEVMRLSIVRHAFRRALEIWLVLDLAVHLEESGYAVGLGVFCPRELTPRNLLLSARRRG